MEYICKRCNYCTDRVSNIKQHLRKKKTCPDKMNSGFSVEDLLKDYHTHHEYSLYEYSCQFCGHIFKSRQGLHKHMTKCNIERTDKELKRLSEENEQIKKTLEAMNKSTTNSHIEYNTTNNTTNIITNNNITNNITIVLNEFGKEDMSYIEGDKEFLNGCMKDLLTNAIRTVIDRIYFDTEHPENRTIMMKNFKLNQVMVYDSGQWKQRHTSETIPKMLHNGKKILHNHFVDSGDDQRIIDADEDDVAMMKFNYLNNVVLPNTNEYKSAVSKIKSAISNHKYRNSDVSMQSAQAE